MDSLAAMLDQSKPFLAVIFLQFGISGMSLITKSALDQGMNQHVLVVYRHAIATLVIAPFAIVFDRLEKVNIRKFHSQAKILGTVVTVGGAMLMTLINGPMLQLPWTKSNSRPALSAASAAQQDPIKGALMICVGCFCWAGFVILQAITIKSYPAELSLTALICFAGTIEGSIVALAMEAGNAAVWSVHLDVKLLAAVYGGVVCSGIGYYVQGVIMKTRGPVFVTAFNPLSMVIVAILSSFILSEMLYLGRVLGAVVIVAGLYMVLWGKSKDQQSSEENFETHASNDEKMVDATDDHYTTTVSDQDFVVLDLNNTKVTPTVETV
ncbi:hypothetical protein V6N11_004315 [Hibiscus sabdariffa]|uniref:Uncharacterized protein n=2 Tax=Hibiscus sabdariffa TaxID=183260 RepID=A0ABR1ZR14_9ROSI